MTAKNLIYVIGSSNTDMVIKADRLPSPGETVIGETFLMNPGGKGANQAVSAARLGGLVTLVAKVGNDVFGKQAIKLFQKENINVKHVFIDPDHASGVALINVDAKGENCISVAPGSNSWLKPVDVDPALINLEKSALVLLQHEIPMQTVEYVIRNCFEKDIRVILNPAPALAIQQELLSLLFLITPNETEAELLTGIKVTNSSMAEKAAKQLKLKGVKNVIITMGTKGAFLLTDFESKLIPAPPVTALDTTGAGDCFNGALAVALSEEKSFDEAVAFACKAASISVTRMGAQSAMPFRAELDNLPLGLARP